MTHVKAQLDDSIASDRTFIYSSALFLLVAIFFSILLLVCAKESEQSPSTRKSRISKTVALSKATGKAPTLKLTSSTSNLKVCKSVAAKSSKFVPATTSLQVKQTSKSSSQFSSATNLSNWMSTSITVINNAMQNKEQMLAKNCKKSTYCNVKTTEKATLSLVKKSGESVLRVPNESTINSFARVEPRKTEHFECTQDQLVSKIPAPDDKI